MTRVFISYSRNDGTDAAERLQQALEEQGFDTWRDVRNIDPARDFTIEIERGIENSDWVAVCVTPESKTSAYVHREIHYAQMEDKPVIPLRFAKITPHLSICEHELVEFFEGWDMAFRRLIEIFDGEMDQFRIPPSSDDPFRPYVEYLYQRCVEYFKHSIIGSEPIELTADPTENAVDAPPMPAAPRKQFDPFDQLFYAQGITPDGPESETDGDEPQQFARFADAYEYYGGRVLLLGEPGAGKTITLMAHTRNAAAARLDDPSALLPLFQTITLWDAEHQTPLDEWLAEGYGDLLSLDAVQREIEAGRVLYLLDGLDELGEERENPDTKERYDPRKRFMGTVGAIHESLLRNRVLVTCRVKDYTAIGRKIALNGAVTLNPLTDEQIREYLGEDSALWAALEADDDLREVARTPLLMALFAEGYRENAADATALRNLSASPGALRDAIFERYINQRYAWEDRKHGPLPFTLEEIYEVLGRVAMKNAAGGYRVMDNVLLHDDFARALDKRRVPGFIELVVKLDLLASRAETREYHFIHLLLRDTLGNKYALNHLRDANAGVRRSASDSLSRIGDTRAVEPLIAILHDTDRDVRRSAAYALGKIGDTRAVEPRIADLRDTDWGVQYNASIALGQIADSSSIELLIPILHDDYWAIRFNAAYILERIGEPSVKHLIDMLHHEYAKVRSLAADILGRIGDPRAIAPLNNTLNDELKWVSESAMRALAQIATPRHTLRFEQWRADYDSQWQETDLHRYPPRRQPRRRKKR